MVRLQEAQLAAQARQLELKLDELDAAAGGSLDVEYLAVSAVNVVRAQ